MRVVHAPKDGVVIVISRDQAKAVKTALRRLASIPAEDVTEDIHADWLLASTVLHGLDYGILL